MHQHTSDGTDGRRLGATGVAIVALAVLGIILAAGSLVLLLADDPQGTAAGDEDAATAAPAPGDATRTDPDDDATGDGSDQAVEAGDGDEGEGAEVAGDGEPTAGTVEADGTADGGPATDDASLDDDTVELDPPTGTDPTASSTTAPTGPGGDDAGGGSGARGNGSGGAGAGGTGNDGDPGAGEGGCELAVAELNGQAGTVTGIGSGDCAGIEVTTRSVADTDAVTAVDWPTEIMLCERHPSAVGITVTATIGGTATELVDAYVRGFGSTDGPLTAIELTFAASIQQPAIQPILVCRTTDAEAAIIRRSGS